MSFQAAVKEFFPTVDLTKENLGVGSIPEWDSMAHFNFLLFLEEKFSVRFTMEEISELKTLRQIKKALEGRSSV